MTRTRSTLGAPTSRADGVGRVSRADGAGRADGDGGAAAGGSVAAAGPSLASRARRGRNITVWALVLVLAATVVALLQGGRADTYLDPDGTGQQGIRGALRVLEAEGVRVDRSASLADLRRLRTAAGADRPVTVAVGVSATLTRAGADALLESLRPQDLVVLLDGAPALVDSLDLGLLALPVGGPEELTPGCTVPETHGQLRVTRSAVRYVADDGPRADDVLTCYSMGSEGGVDHGWLMLDVPATEDRPRILALGMGPSFTNRFITEGDNAALALRLLGSHDRLILHTPSITDALATGGPPSDASAPPPWVLPGLVVLGLTVLTYAAAAGRRHGRLVPEPLPVVVKASETTHSRAQLYRAAGDRERAAITLRAGTIRRLRTHFGLGPGTLPEEVVTASVARGIPTAEATDLLTGPPPTDDAGLVRLANALTALEQKVTDR